MKKKLIITWLAAISSIIMISGCTPDPGGNKPRLEFDPVAVFPGECIRTSSFGFQNGFRITGDMDGQLGFMDEFILNLAKDSDQISDNLYRWIPRTEVFDAFGDDAQEVRSAYEEIYTAFRAQFGAEPEDGYITTVYYCGGLVITADKDFAGIPAGENLASIVHIFPDVLEQYPPIPTIEVPEGYIPLRLYNPFKFWIEDHEVVNEYVTFKIEMPLKVGMMLTLLRDRLTDPDATMQFRDELFTGNVMFPNGLR